MHPSTSCNQVRLFPQPLPRTPALLKAPLFLSLALSTPRMLLLPSPELPTVRAAPTLLVLSVLLKLRVVLLFSRYLSRSQFPLRAPVFLFLAPLRFQQPSSFLLAMPKLRAPHPLSLELRTPRASSTPLLLLLELSTHMVLPLHLLAPSRLQ
jgi:hypothetical protein